MGVYVLYKHNKVVYVGKTSGSGLYSRLDNHRVNITGRQGLNVLDITCRFIVTKHSGLTLLIEDELIKLFKPDWQNSGFGSYKGKSTGQTYAIKRRMSSSHFDIRFPKTSTRVLKQAKSTVVV
jgi:hypothetical protein